MPGIGEVEGSDPALDETPETPIPPIVAKSEQFLTHLFETMPLAIYVLDLEQRAVSFVNRRCREILGFDEQIVSAAAQTDFVDIVHPDDRKTRDQFLLELMNLGPGETTLYECRVRHADGSWRWFRFRDCVLVSNVSGFPIQTLGTAEDINAWKVAQDQLRASEARYRAVTDNAFEGISLTNRSGEFTLVSRGIQDYLGLPVEKLVGMKIFDVIHAEDVEETRELFERLPDVTGSKIEGNVRLRTASGEWRWNRGRACNLLDDPNVGAIVVNFHEYHQERLATQSLHESQARLKEAIRIAQLGNWEWMVGEGKVFWSEELHQIFGTDPATFKTTYNNLLKLIHPDDLPMIETHIAEVLTRKCEYSFQHRITRPDGEIRWIQAVGRLELGPDGAPYRLAGTSQDITDRIRVENERRQVDEKVQRMQKLESLGILAGGIAHDFNNLLTSMLGFVGLARALVPDHPAVNDHLQHAENAARQAADLCRQLLAYAGKGQVQFSLLDVSSLVQDVCRMLRSMVPPQSRVELQLDENLPKILGDATQLKQVVMNLVTNAFESIERKPGLITLRTSLTTVDEDFLGQEDVGQTLVGGETICLEITDNGVGMDEETMRRIFDPFFTTKFVGRGLGLAAALGIARSHQGAIRVESEVGKGTTFTVLFPRAKTK